MPKSFSSVSPAGEGRSRSRFHSSRQNCRRAQSGSHFQCVSVPRSRSLIPPADTETPQDKGRRIGRHSRCSGRVWSSRAGRYGSDQKQLANPNVAGSSGFLKQLCKQPVEFRIFCPHQISGQHTDRLRLKMQRLPFKACGMFTRKLFTFVSSKTSCRVLSGKSSRCNCRMYHCGISTGYMSLPMPSQLNPESSRDSIKRQRFKPDSHSR